MSTKIKDARECTISRAITIESNEVGFERNVTDTSLKTAIFRKKAEFDCHCKRD